MARASAESFPARSECPGTHWRDTETEARERLWREDQMEWMGAGSRAAGEEDRVVRAERESDRRRSEEKEQVEWWETDQERACWIAMTSA